ncbi:hypothetical protein [Saccharothrix algeriensis]|uniref:Uncharacterized protein n=1 Tax=Saccharothrix algeriensis TaxID=173560 RepID=A0A8T8HUP6_9PSEU|nr:hypothetical protein [Saccharothrix algeriensis]MBM7813846.1 hypothetical protein [Saccharothrix algeriensis]QTR02293.1 hypothetical protein J7S33_24430 [Saccharothrix algeriensis]
MSRRVLGAVLLGAGGVLALVGTLLDLYRLEGPAGAPPGTSFTLTAWRIAFEAGAGGGPVPRTPQWGYALVPAGGLAVLGAVLQFRSPVLAAVGRFAAVAGFGALAATTWSVHTTVTTLFGGAFPPAGYADRLGPGLWAFAAACPVLLAGALLVQEWPRRVPVPAGAAVHRVDGDDDTPPFGIPVPTDLPSRPGEGRPPSEGNPSTVE